MGKQTKKLKGFYTTKDLGIKVIATCEKCGFLAREDGELALGLMNTLAIKHSVEYDHGTRVEKCSTLRFSRNVTNGTLIKNEKRESWFKLHPEDRDTQDKMPTIKASEMKKIAMANQKEAIPTATQEPPYSEGAYSEGVYSDGVYSTSVPHREQVHAPDLEENTLDIPIYKWTEEQLASFLGEQDRSICTSK